MLMSKSNFSDSSTMLLPLHPATEYKSLGAAFRDIRNYLAGRVVGITQDKLLLDEVVKCLFCKVLVSPSDTAESEESIAKLYRDSFNKIKSSTNGTFSSDEEIKLDAGAIAYVHSVLSQVDLDDPLNDPLSEAYQTFIGSAIRGKEGQFFTPIEAVRWLVEAVSPKPGELIIDPACGAGSFLSFSARFLKEKGASRNQIRESIYGIDKDEYLTKLANTHLALTTLKTPNIICADSIERKTEAGLSLPFEIDEKFDVVLANPPFGAKIHIGSEKSKRDFDLAYKWKWDSSKNIFVKTDTLQAKPTPQILFIELCLKLLKPGGRMGIVVPESMISNATSSYVTQYLIEKSELLAVVGMPENLFKTSGKGGTHTKTCLIVARKKESSKPSRKQIFMAEAKWCGHDSRGNVIPHNDLPSILNNYFANKADKKEQRLGYKVAPNKINNFILAPRYYDPTPQLQLSKLQETHDLIPVSKLVDDGVLEFSTGNEVGKLAYGTGDIPFIRTSDISNWEIKIDPKHGVSEEIYKQYASRQDVREGDILMVRDGTYLIGTCAFVSKYDAKITYQSHIYKIRVKEPKVISPYLLLAALSSDPVVRQIKSKRFTQDIIDTLGKRVFELVLPIPKDLKRRNKIEKMVKDSIHDRIEARELARKAKHTISSID